jgi:YycE-like N-terminal domain
VRRGLLMKTAAMGIQEPERVRWPGHIPVGALQVVRWSANYDQTVLFYRDMIGLPVLETFHDSYGLDGTILGLPGGAVHLEIVQLGEAPDLPLGVDQLVFYLPDAAAQESIMARLAAQACIRSPRSITGRTTAALPTKTLTGGKWCSRPGSTARRECANLTWPTWWG